MHTRLALGIITLLAGLLAWSASGISASSINTALPADGFPFAPAVIRGNFGASANDIAALQSMNSGATAPSNPTAGMLWLHTPASGPLVYTLNIWDTNAWVPIAALDTVNHLWNAPIGGGALSTLLSAVTTDLGAVPGASLYISGANPIQSFGPSTPTGQLKVTLFTGAATLVQNATTMILPGGANIVQQAGDISIELALGGGNWQVIFDSRILQSCSGAGGFSCTTTTTKTSSYVTQSSDCGNTIELDGNAFYSVTFNAASSYLPNCQITLLNIDAARGKQIVFAGGGSHILWPLQEITWYSNGTSWNNPSKPRWRLAGNTTIYVDPVNGSDTPTEDCLAPLSGACQTIQGAINLLQQFVDINGNATLVSLVADTNPGDYKPFQVDGPWIGVTNGNNVTISGASSTASAYLLDGQGANSCVSSTNFAHVHLQNITLQNCNILVGGPRTGNLGSPSHIVLANVATGNCSGVNGFQLLASDGTVLEITGHYNIIGSANCYSHYRSLRHGTISGDASVTGTALATVTANLSYSRSFASASRNSNITFQNFSASPFVLGGNTVTGNEFDTEGSSTIQVGINEFFPGSAFGLTLDSATYNPAQHNGLPTISPCGGGSPSISLDASDYAGVITEGTTVTSCAVTFNFPFQHKPFCQVSPWNMPTIPTNLSIFANNTTLTFTHGSTSGATLSYSCHGG